MSQLSFDSPSPPSVRRGCRPVLFVLLFAGVFGAVILGLLYLRVTGRVQSRLDAALAEADRLDPEGWRLKEIEPRPAYPLEGANPADHVMTAFDLLPAKIFAPSVDLEAPPNLGDFLTQIGELPSNRRFDEERRALLEAGLDAVAPALEEVRPVADMGEGRFPLHIAFNPMMTLLPDVQNARDVARLLQLDVARRAWSGDLDGALESCRATLGVARAIGDEPIHISQIVRMAFAGVATKSIERTLGQGEASDAALALIQAQLALEAGQPLGLYGIRGERAIVDDVLTKLEAGQLTVQSLGGGGGGGGLGPMPFAGTYFRQNRAAALEYLNQGVAIARRPIEEQSALWVQFERQTSTRPGGLAGLSTSVATMLLPALGAGGKADVRRVAGQRVAIVLLAAERHHLATGKWPDSVDDLAPYLPEGRVPLDPYSTRPILIRRLPDGLVVYSTSVNGIDDGGFIDDSRYYGEPGHDLGFRLWDVSERGIAIEVAP